MLSREGGPEAISLPVNHVSLLTVFYKGQCPTPVDLAPKASDLLGKHPAGNGLLKGGRNSLLESAQKATF
jgi:hypothetical protein